MSLAALLDAGEVFGFEHARTFWIPIFQFELRDLSVRPELRKMLAELRSVFDGSAIAVWFAQPNAWLQGRRPVDPVLPEFPAVLEAARTDRFIAAA